MATSAPLARYLYEYPLLSVSTPVGDAKALANRAKMLELIQVLGTNLASPLDSVRRSVAHERIDRNGRVDKEKRERKRRISRGECCSRGIELRCCWILGRRGWSCVRWRDSDGRTRRQQPRQSLELDSSLGSSPSLLRTSQALTEER